MPTHEITLDLLKETQLIPPEVTVRVGEGGTQTIKAKITSAGEAYTIEEGWEASICVLTADHNSKTQEAAVSDDTVEITLADEMLTDEGTCELAYFKLAGPKAQNQTTEGFKLRVEGTTTTGDAVRSWDGQLDALRREFELWVDLCKAQEAERVANELERIDNEELRQKQEDRREKQEKQRQAADKKRDQANQTAVKNAEAATETANTAANTATTAATHADEATEASRQQTQAAKEATDAANAATAKSEEQTQAAKDATDAAKAATKESETQTGKAGEATERANAAAKAAEDGEAERIASETERKASESERVASEALREAGEETRQSQEQTRQDAAKAQAEAAEDQATRQQANDAAQRANDLAQLANNAAQEANNQAAYNHQFILLEEGQYDPDSRKPTIEGPASGPVYQVPKENPTETNKYDEWYWTVKTDGTGEWEGWTATQIAEAPAIPVEKIDRIVSGGEVSGDEVVKTTSLSYYDKAVKKRTADAIGDAVEAQATVQKTKDDEQDTAIEAAKKTGDDAASALDSYKTTQSQTDSKQDEAIKKAQETADAAKSAIPPTVTGEAGGILPAFPAEGGPLYPVVKDGELIGWQVIPVFDTTQAGLVPVAPPEDGGVKVLLSTGWGDYKGSGGMPDYRSLKASIAAAEKVKSETKVAGGDDYDFGTEVATQQAVSDLEAAIETAKGVYALYDDPNTTQEMLDRAAEAMEEAVETFTTSIAPLQPDKSGLEEQEGRYTTLKGSVVTSADGKDVPFGDMWVTSAEQQAADTALQAARTAVAAAKKQSDITSAVNTLDSALDTYESARKTATKDTAALDRAIEDANNAKADVKTSDSEGSDLPGGSKYVTTEQMQAFTDAISTAQGSKASASTQKAIDDATSALTQATSTFQGQVKTNWTEPDDIADASWEDIAMTCDLASEDGDTYYNKYKGQTKKFNLKSTTYGTELTIRVDDAANMDKTGGGKCGLHFTIIDGLNPQVLNSAGVTTGGIGEMPFTKDILPKIIADFPDELQAKLVSLDLHVHTTPSTGAKTTVSGKAHLVTMNQWFGEANLKSGGYSGQTWWFDEETWLRWNQENDSPSNRIIKNQSHSANDAWSSSVYSSSSFGRIRSNGNPSDHSASTSRVPALGFSLSNE